MNKDAPWEKISTLVWIAHSVSYSFKPDTNYIYQAFRLCAIFPLFRALSLSNLHFIAKLIPHDDVKTKSSLSALMQKLDTPTIIPFFYWWIITREYM